MGRRSQGVAVIVHLEAELHIVQLEATALKSLGAQPTGDAMQAQHVPHNLKRSCQGVEPVLASNGSFCLGCEEDSRAAVAVLLLLFKE